MSNEANDDESTQLQQLGAHPALEILIRTGTQHWASGEISLVVRGSGTAEVTPAPGGHDGVLRGRAVKR